MQDRGKRIKSKSSRYSVDLMDVHRSIAELERGYRPSKALGKLFAIVTALIFFILGYLISAISVPAWTKVIFLVLIAILAFIPGYFIAFLFR